MNIDEIVTLSNASQDKKELRDLLAVFKDIPIHTVLEIGVHKGYSLQNWKRMWPGAVVIGIDDHIEDLDQQATEGCIVIYADSHEKETLEMIQNTVDSIDMLFIDGDHTYDGVKSDYEMYSKMVGPGGYIVFHDVCVEDNDTVDVRRFFDEIKEDYSYRIINYPNGTGIGIIKK